MIQGYHTEKIFYRICTFRWLYVMVTPSSAAVSASYDDAPEAVRSACLKALSRTPNILPDPAPQVVLTAYGESSIEYHVRFWAKTEDYWDAHSATIPNSHKTTCFSDVFLSTPSIYTKVPS